MRPDITAILNIPNDVILKPKDVAGYLGLTSTAVRQRIQMGKIPAVKVGGRYWVKGRDIKALVVNVIPEFS